MNPDPPLIDDFRPLGVVRPATAAEAGDLVRRAAAEGVALYPVGGGTTLDLGLPPVKPGYGVDLTALDQVIDYPARDMTITVQAGITIAKLQQILAAENQRLPIDVPAPEQATLGGAIAVNASGPRRFGFGTLRDYVIGISFLTDSGNEAKAGGRVVKNVAGYDLCKLQIGALGTLGIMTQVTLKLKPLPEDSQFVVTAFRPGELAGLLERIHSSKTRPVCVDVTSSGESGQRLFVGFEDSAEAAAWQVDQLRGELSPAAISVRKGAQAAREWEALTDSPLSPAAKLSLKANLLPSALPEFLAELDEVAGLAWQAHAGNGIAIGHWQDAPTLEDASRLVSRLRRLAVAGQGNVIVTRCPTAWKRGLGVWGEPRGDLALMRKVKHELDPRDLFNPGRFLV